MLRLPVSCLLLAVGPLAAQAQTAVDSVVRTTTVTTITTTTVTKPAGASSRPAAPAAASSTTTTTTTAPVPTASSAPASAAANAPARQPGPGDLTGARPSSTTSAASAKTTVSPKSATTKTTPASSRVTTSPARPAAATAHATAPPTDPELAHLIKTDVDLTKVRAEDLTNLYERFMETTRAERRQWTTAQWSTASAALSRLNQRYEQVRGDLSLEEKLNIRTLQGEFRTLEAAKQVSKRL